MAKYMQMTIRWLIYDTHWLNPRLWGYTIIHFCWTSSPTNYYQMSLKEKHTVITDIYSSGIFNVDISSDHDVWSQVCPWLCQVWEGHWMVVDLKLTYVYLMLIEQLIRSKLSYESIGICFNNGTASAFYGTFTLWGINYHCIWNILWQPFRRCLYHYELIQAGIRRISDMPNF